MEAVRRVYACAICLLLASCQRDTSGGPGGTRELVSSTGSLKAAHSIATQAVTTNIYASEDSADHFAPDEASDSQAPTSGEPSPTCVRGWSAPQRGSDLRKVALDMIRADPNERFMVEEIRYFVGPEDAEVIGEREVERWYVKAHGETSPGRRQRWLVRRAEVGRGVDAVAPYDSKGYGAGIWVRTDALEPGLADPFLYPCHLDRPEQKCMGLPREVLGCLKGT
jgi:hypothetical protein